MAETTQLQGGPAVGRGRRRARRVAAGALVALTSVAVLAASLALWTRRTLFDSGRVAAVAGHVVDDPAVIEAVSNRLTVEVLELVDAEALLAQALPPGLAPVAPLLVGAVANAVEQQVEAVLSSPSGQDLLVALVRRAHQAAVALLEGDGLGDGVTVAEGTVTLNLLPLVDDVLRALQGRGIVPASLDIPDLAADGEPSEQLRELADRLGVDLAPDAGQVVVYQSGALARAGATLATAQRAVALFDRALVVLVLLAVVLGAGALLVSTNRWRTAAQIGLGTALAVVVTAVAVRRVTAALPAHVAAPGGRAALEAGLEAVTTSLRTMLWLLAGLGLLVGGAGFLFGRSDAATALRARVVAVGERAGRVPVAGGGRVAAAVADHADGARLAVLGVAALVLFVGGLSWASVVVVGVVVAAGLALVELARRRTPAPTAA